MDKWKITSVFDKSGAAKEVPQKRLDRIYVVNSMQIGHPLVMMAADGAMISSFVESFSESEDILFVVTENTRYYFEKVKEEL